MNQHKPSADVLAGRMIEFVRSPRGRTVIYASAATLLASVLMFCRLGAPAMTGDEATYAMEADTMRATGNWLDVVYAPGHPMYQKPPLYLWLTNLAKPLLGDSEIAYRAASASFGVASVTITVLLAAAMFGPEIGLLAGLILLTNANYVFNHGARTGTFDTGLASCFVLATWCVWSARSANSSFLPWITSGVLFGLACLLKPFAGIPMLGLLTIVAFLPAAEAPLRRRLIGIAIALGAMLLVALPWYIAEILRHGSIFIEVIFWQNLVARSFSGLDPRAFAGPMFYWTAITKSSTFFSLFIPALVFSGAIFICGRSRPQYGAIFLLAAGWIAIFSISVSKFIHYAYPVFPIIAISIAVLLVAIVERAAQILKDNARRNALSATLIGALAIVLAVSGVQTLFARVKEPVERYRPWETFKVLQPAISADRARIVFVGFPDNPGDWWPQADIRSSDHFYLKRMQPAVTINSQAADQLLAEHIPTLLLVCRSSPLSRSFNPVALRPRLDQRFCYEQSGFVMLGLDLDPLFHASIHDSAAAPVLSRIRGENSPQPADAAFESSFSVSLDAPIAAAAWVTADVKLNAAAQATRLLFTATVDGSPAAYAALPPSTGDRELTVHLLAKSFKQHHPLIVKFQLSPMDGAARPVIGTVEDIRFNAYPSPPDSRDE